MEKICKRGAGAISVWLLALLLLCGQLFPLNASALSAGAEADAAGGGPRDIMLSVTGDACTTQTVTWHDDEAAEGGTVVYSPDESAVEAARQAGDPGDSGELSRKVGSRVAVESGADVGESVFCALLSGLRPETVYYYYIESGSGSSEVRHFTTAAEGQQSLSFMYLGDLQPQENMAEEFEAWGDLAASVYKRNPDLAFGLMGGDIVNNGIRPAEWSEFLKNASGTFSYLPFMPVNGNHESNVPGGKPELYLDMFSLPENGPDGFKEEFYSFDYGICHVTALNSWVFSGEQSLTEADYSRIAEWLREDLTNSGATWNIVLMHHPVYSLASDTVADAVMENWAPIFEECGVDLVFCGHQHVYSRSYPMTDGAVDYEDGITYIMGNSGQKFYSSADETYQEKTIYSVSTCQVVRIDGDSLEVMTYDREGNELDYCSLKPREKAGAPSEEKQSFLDVPDSAWYAGAVDYVSGQGLMNGTSQNLFSPREPMTRAMFVTVLYRMSGASADGAASSVFSDVPGGAYYADAVAWASANGIVTGTDASHFSPSEWITRQQMAAVMYRYDAYSGGAGGENTDSGSGSEGDSSENNLENGSGDVSGNSSEGDSSENGSGNVSGSSSENGGTGSSAGAEALLNAYADGGSVSQYARTAFAWALDRGLFNGTEVGGKLLLQPAETASRSQCAAILMRYCTAE